MGILGDGTTDKLKEFAQNYYANFKPTADDIKALQAILNGAGVANPPLTVDGEFGPKTLAALNEWQRRNNMPVTGGYDGTAKKQVDDALRAISSAGSTPNVTGGIAGALSGAGSTATNKIAAGLSGTPAPASAPTMATAKIAQGLAAGAKNPPKLAAPSAAPTASSNYGAGGGPSGGGGGGAPVSSPSPSLPPARNMAAMSDAELNSIIEREFGALAWYVHVPELVNVIRGALREGIVDPNVIIGRVTKSEWWVKTVPAVRAWTQFVHESGGPSSATVQEAIKRQVTEVSKAAKITGVNMTPERAWDLAVDSLKFGWTGDMIQQNILSDLKWNGENLQGQVGVTADSLRRLADEYLVPISDGTLEKWTKDIIGGFTTEDAFRLYMVEQAKSLFPGLSAALDRGITVRQWTDPYRELAARELELSPDTIDLKDPKWSKPLFQIDKDGNPVQMSLAQWQQELRTNDTYNWKSTRSAKAQAAEMQMALLQEFGAIAR